MRGILYYNERKVEAGVAHLILAARIGCDNDELTVRMKIARFKQLTDLRPKIRTNALHITLNFAKEETLSQSMLQVIAAEYLEKLGFREQPFLVYEHLDASHQHLHIVTTNIQANGKVINLHNLVQRKSEPARKAIEQKFGLVVAEGRGKQIDTREMSPNEVRSMETEQNLSLKAAAELLGDLMATNYQGDSPSISLPKRKKKKKRHL